MAVSLGVMRVLNSLPDRKDVLGRKGGEKA